MFGRKSEYEKKVALRKTMQELKRFIENANRLRQQYIEKAIKARKENAGALYSIARSSLKSTLMQAAKAEQMLANLELMNQYADFAKMSGGFLKGMDAVSKELKAAVGKMDFEKAENLFNKAMEKSGMATDKMEGYLAGTTDSFAIASMGDMLDSEIDKLIGNEVISAESSIDDRIAALSQGNSIAETPSGQKKTELAAEPAYNKPPSHQSNPPLAPSASNLTPNSPPYSTPDLTPTPKRPTGSVDEPIFLKDFLGQPEATEQLEITLNSIKESHERLPHMLFTGGAGLGKTTLAKIVANEMGFPLKVLDGSFVRNNQKLIKNTILEANKTPNTIIFIDEIHMLSPDSQSALYLAMHDGELHYADKVNGKDVSKTVKLLPMTFIGATTHSGTLNKALRERFERQYRLEEYTPERLADIIISMLNKKGKAIDTALAVKVAELCRGVPRRTRKYAKILMEIAGNNQVVTHETVDKWKRLYKIDDLGLEEQERKILKLLVDAKGLPLSLDSLAAAISEEAATVKGEYEQYLLKLCLIARTSGGRVARKRAYEHLGVPVPDKFNDADIVSVEEPDEPTQVADDSSDESDNPKKNDE